jgi:hypothetical protein
LKPITNGWLANSIAPSNLNLFFGTPTNHPIEKFSTKLVRDAREAPRSILFTMDGTGSLA